MVLQDVFDGIDLDFDTQVKFGMFPKKLGIQLQRDRVV